MGGQVSWLIPAALIAIVGLLVVTLRARRTDKIRAATILWGSLARRHRPRLQLRGGDHPPVLQRRARAADRRADRHRRRPPLAEPRASLGPRRPRTGCDDQRGLGVPPPGAHSRLASVAPVRSPRGRRVDRTRSRRAAVPADAPFSWSDRCCRRPGVPRRRTARLLRADGVDASFRSDSERRSRPGRFGGFGGRGGFRRPPGGFQGRFGSRRRAASRGIAPDPVSVAARRAVGSTRPGDHPAHSRAQAVASAGRAGSAGYSTPERPRSSSSKS